MPRRRRRKTAWQPQDQRRLRVRAVRREVPDARKLSRAFIGLALARAEAETQARAEDEARTARNDSEGNQTLLQAWRTVMIPASRRSRDAGSGWVFSQLHLPRPLDAEQVEAMLLRLAADRAAPPLVFEARAIQGQLVRHLAGTPAEHVVWVQRTLRHLLPGLDIDGITEPRPAVQRSVRLRIRPRPLALARKLPRPPQAGHPGPRAGSGR